MNNELETDMSKRTTNIGKSKNTNIESSRDRQNLSRRANVLTEAAEMMMRRIARSPLFSEVFANGAISPQVTFGAGQTVFNKEGKGLVRVMVTLGREQDGDGALVWRLEIPEGFSCNAWGAIEQVGLGCAAIAHNQAKGLSPSEQKKLKENGHVQFQTYGVKRGKLRFALNALNFEPGIVFDGRGCATVNPVGCAYVNVDYLDAKSRRFHDLVGLNVSNVATTVQKTVKKDEGKEDEGESKGESGSTATLDFGTSEARQAAMDAFGASSVAEFQRMLMEMVQARVDGSKDKARKLRSA